LPKKEEKVKNKESILPFTTLKIENFNEEIF
jgi:hypothetical protein